MSRERYGKEIAIHLDGSMPKNYVNKVLAAFGSRVTIVSTVDMINEGADLPNCWCVQLASFSTSLSKVIQRWGRVLRPQEGKVAVILDHVGISAEHGLPDDYREWDLRGWVDPEKIKLYCYHCNGLISKDKRTISRDKIDCPHCQQINYLERTERDSSPGSRGNYDLDPNARLVEVSERSQTRQIKRILKKREQQSNKAFWAVYQVLVVPDLELPDFMQLCIGLGYKKGYAYRLLEIYKIVHDSTNLCSSKVELTKALGESADRYWATYCKIHELAENV
jgi:phage FluMu protein Com